MTARSKKIRSRRGTPPPAARSLDQGALKRLVGYNLRRADVRMLQHFRRALLDRQIRPAEYSIMLLVRSNPLATQSELATALAIKRPNLVGLIGRLEHRGLLGREVDKDDRRHHGLSLTRRGDAALDRIDTLVLDMDRRVTRCWTAAERAVLVELLQRFYK